VIAALALAALLASAAPAPAPASDLPEGLLEGWYARIDTTLGTMVARLLPDNAPQATAHFAALAEGRLPWADLATGEEQHGRYYDGMAIHKVKAGERFEVGDWSGTGRGAPLIRVPLEKGTLRFDRPYRLGMTRSSLNRISGVVFFVSVGSMDWLTGLHPCFGELVSGKDVAWNIATVTANSSGKPVEPVVVRSIRILSVGSPPPLPEPLPYTPPPPPTLSPREHPIRRNP
jgi:cyclophilin family peptidyl-prolyl cis-trans isomerase